MRRLIGFILFWLAVGMLFSLLLQSVWIEILFIIGFLIVGYQLFVC